MAKKMSTGNLLVITAIILMCLISVLCVGVAYGRYSTSVGSELNFSAFDVEYIQLHGITDEESRSAGEWNSMPTEWLRSGEGRVQIPFCVSNGASDLEHFTKDLKFRLQLTATSGFLPEKATIKLIVPSEHEGENKIVVGEPTTISENSSLHKLIGDGYVYKFFDEDGKEMSFDLSGDRLSVVDLRLSVGGEADTSLITFSVIPEISEQ